jgi:hypothetical protein
MAGGYEHRPDGTDGVSALLKNIQSQVDALRSGAGIRSAVLRGAQLIFQDEDGDRLAVIGTTTVDRIDASGERSSVDAHGSLYYDPITGDLMFIVVSYPSSGDTIVQAGDVDDYGALDLFRVFAGDVGINGNDVDINSTADLSLRADGFVDINPSSLDIRIATGTTGSAANLYKDPFTGQLARSTSALKYKTDIADADVDPVDVLALQPRTWVDKAKLDKPEQAEHLRRDIGFIAEELDEHPSLRQFVVYDLAGEPDAIEYDRLTVALLELAKAQQKQIDDLDARLTALENVAVTRGSDKTPK